MYRYRGVTPLGTPFTATSPMPDATHVVVAELRTAWVDGEVQPLPKIREEIGKRAWSHDAATHLAAQKAARRYFSKQDLELGDAIGEPTGELIYSKIHVVTVTLEGE